MSSRRSRPGRLNWLCGIAREIWAQAAREHWHFDRILSEIERQVHQSPERKLLTREEAGYLRGTLDCLRNNAYASCVWAFDLGDGKPRTRGDMTPAQYHQLDPEKQGHFYWRTLLGAPSPDVFH